MQRLIEAQAKKLEAAGRITADENGNDVSVLRYPARGAAFFTYKVGRKLNVRYVLEGSVQRASQSATQPAKASCDPNYMRPLPQEVIHNRASGIIMKPHPGSPNIRSFGQRAVANQF